MATSLRDFLLPLFQELDGASRVDEVERIARIARRLYSPASGPESDSLELLLQFHVLGKWLDKVGNLTRVVLAVGIDETALRRTAASIRHLDDPVTDAERAVAAAVMIDRAGVRGFTETLLRARREGSSVMDVVRAAMADVVVPDWMPDRAAGWLHARREARREVCRRLLEELALDDLL